MYRIEQRHRQEDRPTLLFESTKHGLKHFGYTSQLE